VLHPVGPLPAAVYWRRRALALTLLLSLAGGGVGAGIALSGPRGTGTAVTPAAATTSRTAAPALDQVVPLVRSVQPPPATAASVSTGPAPVPGGPCSDAMLTLRVRAPVSAGVGTAQTFDLVVTNTSSVPCLRTLDGTGQELVLLDVDGARIWGSNDCAPPGSSAPRTLAPGQAVDVPLLWSGLTSAPLCTAARVAPPAGAYLLRGRLGTLVSPDAPVTLG
jgi:hypothetical protein